MVLTVSENILEAIKAPVRQIKARVELYSGSTLLDTFRDTDRLISFSIERLGDESKFFGYGIFQKINVKLIDINRELDITTEYSFKVVYTVAEEDIVSNPIFYVTEVHRDENTNELSITAYDALYDAGFIALNDTDIDITATMSFLEFFGRVVNAMSHINTFEIATDINKPYYWESVSYSGTLNYDGTETLTEVLNDIAEAAHQTYYMDHSGKLVFKPIYNSVALEINKSDYITLESGANRRLSSIAATNELGDNISVTSGETGTTQYIRDNGLLTLREDTANFIQDSLDRYADISINQFRCEWRGNPLLEPVDKLILTTKDNNTVASYLINDTVSYDGSFKESTSWNYQDNAEETESNPATLGEALKQTFAKVDKANKEITLLASNTSDNAADIAQLKVTTEGIAASVESTQTSINDLSGELDTVKKDVATKITPEAVEIAINTAIANGVGSVSTTTGFVFNEDGLNITKTDSEMSTLIDEDGMKVSKNEEEVLTADNTGVNAINLTARQYLIIGTYSRFEDFGERTGCFWLGG